MANCIETQAVPSRFQRSARLRVEFFREADRFGHLVQLVDGTTLVPLLASVEGTPTEPGPPSPALQQLHLESRAEGRPVALLVGMAGRSHWSLSAECVPSMIGDATTPHSAIDFDVACRVDGQQPPELRSTYQILQTQLAGDPRRVRVATGGLWELTIHADHDVPTTSQCSGQQLIIAPTESTGATRRWKYRLILSPFDQRTL